MTENNQFNTIIIGGGAAGLMCAAELGLNNKKVLVIEKNSALGRKIQISGNRENIRPAIALF